MLLYTRIFYASVVLLQLGIYYWVTLKIKQKNDLKVLKYTEPAKPMSGEGPTQVTTTVKDYDLAEASKAIRGVLMGLLFVSSARAHCAPSTSGRSREIKVANRDFSVRCISWSFRWASCTAT